MSTESIATESPRPAATGETCARCGAPLAADQRYCLECGERRMAVSSFLQSGPPTASAGAPTVPSMPSSPPQRVVAADGAPRAAAVTVIAGIGVLLLAMGVGVLIGRAGAPRQSARPAQVITIADGSGATAPAPSEQTFTGDWPSGTSGFAVELQKLPESGTRPSQVQAAKAAATAKGASAVGALESEEFTSLTAGSYVIYSGEFHKRAEAEKALTGLRKKFPGASVIKVSNGGSSAGSKAAHAKESSGAGSSLEHPAPPSVLEGESKAKGKGGKSYEEKSKDLPEVVET